MREPTGLPQALVAEVGFGCFSRDWGSAFVSLRPRLVVAYPAEERLCCKKSAIDHQMRASNVARLVAREEKHAVGDFFHTASTA